MVIPHPQRATTASHFWWRPGWSPGRSYLTWHVVVADDQQAVAPPTYEWDVVVRLPLGGEA